MTPSFITHIETRANLLKRPVAEILNAAGVDWSTWWRWKNGKASPTMTTLAKIERAMDEIEKAAA